MTFLYPYLLLLLLLLPLLWRVIQHKSDPLRTRFTPELYQKMVSRGGGLSRRVRQLLLLLALAFAIIALSRPVIEKGEIKVEQSTMDIVVAFDISQSMFANDLFPNRFELAKQKFFHLLDDLKEARVGLIGFSSRAFLIAPLTEDFASIKYLVEHLGFGYVSLKGTNILAPLEVTEDLLKESDKKVLVIFTDGGDQKDFSKEIAYAKEHGIKVFIYAVATPKGGVMKIDGDVVRDKQGRVVITQLNSAVKALAEATGGVYMNYSLSSDDMKQLAKVIQSRLKRVKQEDKIIKDRQELFYYPLMLSILLFLMAYTSLPKELIGNLIRGRK